MRFFPPVVKNTSIQMLLAIVVQFDLELEQMDVKIMFLHGELDEKIYMKQPECYIQDGKKTRYVFQRSPSMELGSDTNGSTLS